VIAAGGELNRSVVYAPLVGELSALSLALSGRNYAMSVASPRVLVRHSYVASPCAFSSVVGGNHAERDNV